MFIDEIQEVVEIQNPYVDDESAKIGFVDAILGLMQIKNVDLYVTGSNSHMLSSDILTEFKDRGDEIRVNPLTYSEFYAAFDGEKRRAWRDWFLRYRLCPGKIPIKALVEVASPSFCSVIF